MRPHACLYLAQTFYEQINPFGISFIFIDTYSSIGKCIIIPLSPRAKDFLRFLFVRRRLTTTDRL